MVSRPGCLRRSRSSGLRPGLASCCCRGCWSSLRIRPATASGSVRWPRRPVGCPRPGVRGPDRQFCTSRNVPTLSNSSTATNSDSGAQSSGAYAVGTSRFIVCSYSRTVRVSGPGLATSGSVTTSDSRRSAMSYPRSLATGAAPEDVGKVPGREDAGGCSAYIGDGVDGPVGVERWHVRREVIERHRERHAHIEWRVTVNPDPPARRPQAPVRLHVHGDEAVLG
jgi:hypothetical protein